MNLLDSVDAIFRSECPVYDDLIANSRSPSGIRDGEDECFSSDRFGFNRDWVDSSHGSAYDHAIAEILRRAFQ
jgi:hypothetical protein